LPFNDEQKVDVKSSNTTKIDEKEPKKETSEIDKTA